MSENNSREITVRELVLKLYDWFNYLKSKWTILILACICGVVLGYFYSTYKKPLYVAVSTFALEDSDSGGALGQFGGLASMIGVDLGGSGNSGIFQGDNLIELYKSRKMIQEALLAENIFNGKRQSLINRYVEFNNLKAQWANNPVLKNLNFKPTNNLKLLRAQDSVLGEVVKEIGKTSLVVTKPDKKLSIIKVQVTSKDELFSKAFNDQIVKNVNEFYVNTKTKKSTQNVSILQHQTDSVKRELNGALSGVAALTDANPNPNPARQILRVPSQRRQVDAQANTAILTELVKNLELSKVSQRKETPLIQMIDAPILPLQKVVTTKTKGMVIGGFVFGFLMAGFLLTRRGFKSIVS
ncbi:lipopolysaccharide biosynthesis protein [Pedobacter rhodius]|uniref:Lipopolysaccharide biosynthesis protein n=1 Tax=Pedobacter rhodius TaxID=3004098 RepID=A0ABT4KZI8_9SPHI|nr:lipopolysaccharide biosynthesis protein [Pedobacter sp. SJ11]MCZ4224348.1 lipopolysaccharide biosynthesis protein [Pedobacter sp. SJ11]